METRTDKALLGGVAPAFVVEVTASGTSYRSARGRSSIDELTAALRVAAHTKSTTGLVTTLVSWAHGQSPPQQRVPVVYHLDGASAHAFESLGNGVAWLASSRGVWRVMSEGTGARVPAHVWRGQAENILTNIAVPSIAAGGHVLHFLPDALFMRDSAGNIYSVDYAALHVDGESATGQVALSWRDSKCVFVTSKAEPAWHFANAVRALTREKTKMTSTSRMSTPPTELERVLQQSIDRKRRLDELEREAAVSVSAPAVNANAYWIAQGGNSNVQGLAVGDFVYVGKRMPSFDGSGIEPSAIDPMLPIDHGHANTAGEGMRYWPSYSSISLASRTAYLQWLADGRKDPQVYIGYVFIFFYGLERRVYEFIQKRGSSADEVLTIAHEVARLLTLHAARSGSFASYAGALLDLIASVEPRARTIPRREPARPGYGVPMRLAISLGEVALAGKPLPANLAYEWLRATQYLNTPATRCESEFELLFHIRYTKQFGDGIVIKPGKTLLDLSYRPASSALEELTVKQRSIPDVTELARPLAKLTEFAQGCTNALDPFSRFLGKNAGGRESLAAFALLPDELVEGTHSADAKALAALVVSRLDSHGRAHLAAGELLQYVRIAKPGKVAKSEAMLLAQSLEKLGYGIEPDVRLGGPVFELEGRVVVFRRLPDCPSTASEEYAAATLLIRLAAMVSAADDTVSDAERELLEEHIEERLRLTAGERQRLAAHLAWIVEADLGMTGVKRKLEALPRDSRRAIGRMLVEIAATDGHVDPREMKVLEKIYAILDLPSTDLYGDVHAAHVLDDGPVVVDEPASSSKGFAIPPKPEPAATTAAGLDMSRVRLKIAETRQVSALLGSIFVEDEVPARRVAVERAGAIGTLDAAHSELLRRLAERESWPRDEVERLAGELSLLPDGALETINDYAYATANEAFWEDSDPLAINSKVAMELMQ